MRAESIPQGYGIYSARMRNMRLIQEKIVEGVVFLKKYTRVHVFLLLYTLVICYS